MARVGALDPQLERILAAKRRRRKALAALPIEEKLRILIEMQKMAAPILLVRGKKVRVWEA